MDSCLLECLQCSDPKAYDINYSHYHGLCENHARALNNDSVVCKTCGSKCQILYLRQVEIQRCSSCNNPSNLKHNCNHYSCVSCRSRQNNNCPICVCISCNSPCFDLNELCKTHRLCRLCSSKHIQCPWCFCRLCSSRSPDSNFPCGHPVCNSCGPESSCQLCKKICSFCKGTSTELKGNHCRNHLACLSCFEEYVNKDIKRCNYCTGNYKNFQCCSCRKVSLAVEEVELEGKTVKICKQCQNKEAVEEEKKEENLKLDFNECHFCQSPLVIDDIGNIPPCQSGRYCRRCIDLKQLDSCQTCMKLKKNPEFKECHFCQGQLSGSDSSNITPCKAGRFCSNCMHLGSLDSCAACSQMKKQECPKCNKLDFLFTEDNLEQCIPCINRSASQAKCKKCGQKQDLQSGLCPNCYKCHVCSEKSGEMVLKSKCQHVQCKACLTSKTSIYCSRCLFQYRCKTHFKTFYKTGTEILVACCGTAIK